MVRGIQAHVRKAENIKFSEAPTLFKYIIPKKARIGTAITEEYFMTVTIKRTNSKIKIKPSHAPSPKSNSLNRSP